MGSVSDNPNNITLKSSTYNISEIVGSDAVHTDDKFAGTINTMGVFSSPTTQTYMIFHQSQIDGTNFPTLSNVLIRVRLTQWVRLYGRRQ